MGCTNSKEKDFKDAQPQDFHQIQPNNNNTNNTNNTNINNNNNNKTDINTSIPENNNNKINNNNNSSNNNNNNTQTNSAKTTSNSTPNNNNSNNNNNKNTTTTTTTTPTPSNNNNNNNNNTDDDDETSDLDHLASIASEANSASTNSQSPRKQASTVQEPPIDMNAELVPDPRRFSDVYELGEEIGQGAFSTVRLGIDRVTKEKCAIKCISKQRIPPEDEAALKQEVIILRALNHPNILKCYGFFDENEFYYLVMEYMAGGELFDRIVQKTFYSEKEARDVVYILLSTIHYCHTRNIVHRDLKPENLLLSNLHDDAFIKLADFGFAISSQGFSTLKTQCGTPGYVAPEILSTQPYGKAVDMWSIGVITYILLGGYPPFYDDNQKVLFEKIKRGEYSFHPEYWDAVSVEAKDLISRLLKVNPLERYTSEEALNHSWITRDAGELAQRSLEANLSHFKKFHATRKFKAAARAIISINRMRFGFKKTDA